MTPRQWKAFYAEERAAIGDDGLRALFDRAPDVTHPAAGALIFPHTRLRESGHLVAAAARAVVRAKVAEVLAIGVLHAPRDEDAPLSARAHAGDAAARTELRGVHGPGAPGDAQRWTEEFSLDNFCALVEVAAREAGVTPPRIVRRFPFLVGDAPDDLPGIDDLRAIAARGAIVVATTDPLHHGVGYGTPAEAQHGIDDVAFARERVAEGFDLLARRDYGGFARHAAATRNDFRDGGPVLAAVLEGALTFETRAIELVDYSATLGAAGPTWVAAVLGVVGVGLGGEGWGSLDRDGPGRP